MNVERLTILRDALKADAANPKGVKFDLSSWAKTPLDAKPTTTCNTYACAVGLACLTPALQAQGLELVTDEYASQGLSDKIYFEPLYDGVRGFDAAEAFFDLSRRAAAALFDPCFYEEGHTGADAEMEVVNRIDELIENGEDPFIKYYSEYYW
jgi:hypothetical protein